VWAGANRPVPNREAEAKARAHRVGIEGMRESEGKVWIVLFILLLLSAPLLMDLIGWLQYLLSGG